MATGTLLSLLSSNWELHPYWYLGRAGGFVAYAVLLISLALGLSISSRLFDGFVHRAWFFELRRFVSILLVAVVLFHALIMLPDPYAQFSLDELLVPFRSDFRTMAMSLGILSLYGMVLVTGSFFLTRWIGQKTWRLVHYLTFIAFIGGTVHGIWIGTDTDDPTVRTAYLGMTVLLVFLIFYRILAARNARRVAPVRAERPIRRDSSGHSVPADLSPGN